MANTAQTTEPQLPVEAQAPATLALSEERAIEDSRILKFGYIIRDHYIRFDEVVADDPEGEWVDDGALPPGGLIVPLALWLKHRDALRLHPRTAVLLQPEDDPALLEEDLPRLSLVVVNFPKFTDGRGLSTARLLRERYGYRRELRAVGHILPDQVYFLTRSGFDAIEIPAARVEDALALQKPFSVAYQGAADEVPLFLRRVA